MRIIVTDHGMVGHKFLASLVGRGAPARAAYAARISGGKVRVGV